MVLTVRSFTLSLSDCGRALRLSGAPGSRFRHTRYRPTSANMDSVSTIRAMTTGRITLEYGGLVGAELASLALSVPPTGLRGVPPGRVAGTAGVVLGPGVDAAGGAVLPVRAVGLRLWFSAGAGSAERGVASRGAWELGAEEAASGG